MKREELISSKEYWLAKIQIDLFNEVNHFMEKNGLNRTQLADILGVSKGYVSQIMNGDSDHRLSKLVELSLAIGLVPNISFEELDKVVNKDAMNDNKIIAIYEEIERSKKTLIDNGYLIGNKKQVVDWIPSYSSKQEIKECCA
ncbi:helix-turn-helix transcriptional regulator [uncultured Bacteroides sp.]|uniref:helix-turn-helix domain-containing protein n=1 Tax=uncultured Bacteroides sp. TaxID=162156 RepID=UPI002AA77E23|nr:helix-turn-helix transcriptional regulator [uncultured Bacteroides sp.]